jgi:hypothetical protein
MRMGAHGVPQPRPQARPLTALMPVPVVVAVAMVMVMAVAVIVIVVRTDRGVHNIQHAPVNALPHIDKYQGRAVAN